MSYLNFVGSWTVFDHMSDDLYLYLLAGKEGFDDTMDIPSVFCGECVVLYSICVGREDVTERAVLYSLDHKMWNCHTGNLDILVCCGRAVSTRD